MKNVSKLIFATSLIALASSASFAAEPLVDTTWLKSNLNKQDLVVLDIRSRIGGGSQEVFNQAHIPGSIYSNYLEDGWRTKDVNGVPGQLPGKADLEALFGKLGISNTSHVVIIPAGKKALDMGSATRVYFTLKVAGHDNVSILDGGFAAWTKNADNPVATGATAAKPVQFTVNWRKELLATKEDVKAALGNKTVLIDNRPANQFSGEKKHKISVRFGTIPGAKNVPESSLTQNGGGNFANPDVLKSLYGKANANTGASEINFCNTGHWASLGWFVSHEIIGNKNAKLYDGSMVEWTADQSAPMTKTVN